MKITVKADTSKAKNKLLGFLPVANRKADRAARATAAFVLSEAQKRAPFDTYHLLNSIQVRKDGRASYQVVVGAYYARYLEGTGKRYRRGPYQGQEIEFMRPAYIAGDQYKRAIVRAYF